MLVSSFDRHKSLVHIGNTSQSIFHDDQNKILNFRMTNEHRSIINKIKEITQELGIICEITRGFNPYDKYRGQSQEVIKNKLYHADYRKDTSFVPFLKGTHIDRYRYIWDTKCWISYGDWLAAPRNPKFYQR